MANTLIEALVHWGVEPYDWQKSESALEYCCYYGKNKHLELGRCGHFVDHWRFTRGKNNRLQQILY